MWEKINPEFAGLLREFDGFLKEQLPEKSGFLSEVSRTVVTAGGKRLRPAFVLLFAGFGTSTPDDPRFKERLFSAAAAVELLHTATLVHDDIIDEAHLRRGNVTVSGKYGTNIAVYTGDYLLVKSLSLLAKSELDVSHLSEVARGLASVCIGEVDQFYQKFQLTSPLHYLKRITRKTALLFSVSAALGAKLAGLSDTEIKHAASFGLYFGTAFQIYDDLLDLKSDPRMAGKPVLKDLKDGIVTLPFILAAKHSESVRKSIELFFDSRDERLADEIISSVFRTGGTQDAADMMKRYAEKALKKLSLFPNGSEKAIFTALLNMMFLSPAI